MSRRRLHRRWRHGLDRFRLRVSRPDAVLELSLLGLLSGLVAGVVSILFRLLVEQAQAGFLGEPGDYRQLAPLWRMLLPIGGGVAIGLVLHLSPLSGRPTGVAHVMERIAYFQGHFPRWNFIVQFVGGAVALVSGHSVGREGPGIHLGAAASALPAQALHLPNNSLRLLAACGTAAAIAASFNTPLAGVVFALEVLMFEYTVAIFAPVILAAVVATLLSQTVFGADLAFSVPPVALHSLWELPYVLTMGLLLGGLSALFITLLKGTLRLAPRLPIWLRPAAAGALVGVIALALPQTMGIGYDTVNEIILGELGIGLLVAILAAKLVASTAAIGLGVPGGLIGPALVIGAATGGALAAMGQALGVAVGVDTGLYVVLGMSAMMAGTLQAPLAALVAILELTGNPHVLFPGMLAVVAATLASGQLQGRESMYLALMRATGRDYRSDPVSRALRHTGVAAAMDRSFVPLSRQVSRQRLEARLKTAPRWVLLRPGDDQGVLLAAVDLARALRQGTPGEPLDLLALPAERLTAVPIDLQANLQEAVERLDASGAEAVFVTRTIAPGVTRVYGIATRDDLGAAYRL